MSLAAAPGPSGQLVSPRLHIALVHPEIPQNTGNIGRLCVGIEARLHLVRPLGFSLDEKAVRRAGIDHWRRVDLRVWDSIDAFLDWTVDRRVHALTRHAPRCLAQAELQRGDVLVFGRESTGLPPELRQRLPCLRIPIPGPVRSLNLSNAVAVAAYRAIESFEPSLFLELPG